MRYLGVFIMVISLVFLSCQNNQKENALEEVFENEQSVESTDISNQHQDREPSDDELSEFGLVQIVEDSGYPFFYLLIEFPERQFEEYFDVNIEELNFPASSLYDLKGQFVKFYYLSDYENSLSDILSNGISILGDDAYHDDEMNNISGVLSGADEISQGDLPGSVNVISKDGQELSFKCYITEEIVAVNNTEVRVYFSEKVSNKITYIRLSE